MTFGEAFAKARKEQGAGGVFTYKGKKYSTNRADDKAKTAKNNVEKKTDIKPVKKPKSNFGEMFAAARERGDREFTDPATGKRYHTRRADETMEQWNKKFKRKDGDAGLNRTDRTKISDPTTPAITNFGKKKLKPVKLADLPNLKDKLEEKKDELLG